jgi:cobalt/nickel transport system permease protein
VSYLAFVVGAIVVIAVLVFVGLRYASSAPDGLERVAHDKGIGAGDTSSGSSRLTGWSGAAIGAGVTFLVAAGAVVAIRRTRTRTRASSR